MRARFRQAVRDGRTTCSFRIPAPSRLRKLRESVVSKPAPALPHSLECRSFRHLSERLLLHGGGGGVRRICVVESPPLTAGQILGGAIVLQPLQRARQFPFGKPHFLAMPAGSTGPYSSAIRVARSSKTAASIFPSPVSKLCAPISSGRKKRMASAFLPSRPARPTSW
jgi:hypothetical protein